MTRVETVKPPKDVLRMLRAVRHNKKTLKLRKTTKKESKKVVADATALGLFEAAFDLKKVDLLEKVKRAREAATVQDDIDAVIAEFERGLDKGDVENVEKAVSLLGLLYVQEEDFAGAEQLLTDHGYLYRLSSDVLRYPVPAGEGQVTPLSKKFVTAYDNALPRELFEVVKRGFSAGSSFWSEHSYKVGVTPYFSYRHDLGVAPVTAMDQVVKRVAEIMMKDIPAAKNAKYAEWWAHCRPHPDGHQLHYDADNEGKGGIRNPLANCIIFLSEDCGGPTLITTQKFSTAKTLSQDGWFMYPKENRIVAYPADILHGVIPGRGIVPPTSRRTTLMVALWGETGCTLRPKATPDASRPFPTQGPSGWLTNPDPTPYTWPNELPTVTSAPTQPPLTPAPPVPVPCIWEDVSPNDNRRAKASVRKLKHMPHYDQCFQGF